MGNLDSPKKKVDESLVPNPSSYLLVGHRSPCSLVMQTPQDQEP